MACQMQVLHQDPDYRSLTAEQKVALAENGECPKGPLELKCNNVWRHYSVSFVLPWPSIEQALDEVFPKIPTVKASSKNEERKKNERTRKHARKKRANTSKHG